MSYDFVVRLLLRIPWVDLACDQILTRWQLEHGQVVSIYLYLYIYIYKTNRQECYGMMLICDANTHNIIPGYITYPTKNKQTE